MKNLLLSPLLLLTSCLFGGTQEITVPLSDLDWLAAQMSQAQNFDRDRDGSLRNDEFVSFMAFLSLQAYSRWALPEVGEPGQPLEPRPAEPAVETPKT